MRDLIPTTRVALFVISIACLWVGVAVVLWWAYDLGAFADGGAYTHHAARVWASELAGIISLIVALVWLFSMNRPQWRGISVLRLAWNVFCLTGAGLLIYAVIILARRYTWVQERGLNDWAMFYGRLNARFFSEAGPLSYVLLVLPAASLLSALLFVAQNACLQRLPHTPQSTEVPGE